MNVAREQLARLEQAFRWAMAEKEGPWVREVFLPPDRWETWNKPLSLLVIAEPGMGRSTLARVWQERAGALVVPISGQELAALTLPEVPRDWQPVARQVLRWALERLILLLVERFRQGKFPPAWTRSVLHPLLAAFLPFGVEAFLAARQVAPDEPGVVRFLDWLGMSKTHTDAPPLSFLEGARYLLAVVRALNYQHLWLLVDFPSSPLPPSVLTGFQALAHVLQWFDLPGWVFRFLVPETVAARFLEAAAVLRRRMMVERLTWTPEQVRRLVERRLQWATQGAWASLRDVVADAEFEAWLALYGQSNPRAWLALLWPFVRERARWNRPLTPETWRELAQRHPPPLYVEEARRRVWLGARPLVLSREEAWRLLTFLYRHRGRYCSREELYYLALEARDRIPAPQDPSWEPPAVWRGRLDTALYRLRQAVEPNPRRPQYVVVQRGRGVVLRHATGLLGLPAFVLDELIQEVRSGN